MFVIHNLTRRTVKFFQNLRCSWIPWVLLSRHQLVRNHFLMLLSKKQQDGLVQPFVHLRWSLKRQSPDYINLKFHFFRSSHRRGSIKGVFKNFAKLTGKHLCQSLFCNNVAGLRAAPLLKINLWHRCFPVSSAKVLKTSFL